MIAELTFHSEIERNQIEELRKKLNEIIQHINEEK